MQWKDIEFFKQSVFDLYKDQYNLLQGSIDYLAEREETVRPFRRMSTVVPAVDAGDLARW